MSLTYAKKFEGEPKFPKKAWGIVGVRPPNNPGDAFGEDLLAILPEDQGVVAQRLAERIGAGDTDVIDHITLPADHLGMDMMHISSRFLNLTGVVVDGHEAIAHYDEREPLRDAAA